MYTTGHRRGQLRLHHVRNYAHVHVLVPARILSHRYREVIKQVVDRMSSLDGKTLALYRSMTQDYDDHVRHPASRPTVDVSS